MHLCAELTAVFWTLEPFGEICANFSLQLSSRTRFGKINKKKVIAENQCKKHKKSFLVVQSEQHVIYKLMIGSGRAAQANMEETDGEGLP